MRAPRLSPPAHTGPNCCILVLIVVLTTPAGASLSKATHLTSPPTLAAVAAAVNGSAMPLSREEIDAIAEATSHAVVRLLREQYPKPDPFEPMTIKEAADYCRLTKQTFRRECKRLPEALRPIASEGPLSKRWHRCALDVYKMTGGAIVRRGRGRPKNNTFIV